MGVKLNIVGYPTKRKIMKNNILLNNSILYRSTQKYFDHQLNDYDIGYGQVIFLFYVYENEGITASLLASKAHYDKATVTSSIQKLEKSGYLNLENNPNDKRSKCLYTTKKAKEVMAKVYLMRKDWFSTLSQGLKIEEMELFESMLKQVADNASKYDDIDENEDKIAFFGIQKLSLLDYPGKMAATIFTGGCNLRCPFCQNSDLVYLPENSYEISKEDIMTFLKKRVNVLEGVCITGGEPLLHLGLKPFIKEVKKLGYLVKLDTNGTNCNYLKELVDEGLIDYIAMDIKNTTNKYSLTVGVDNFNTNEIKKSVEYIKNCGVDYEFRTTIVKEFHTENDIKELGLWLKGSKQYYIQNFEDSERVIQKGLHSVEKETLYKFKDILSSYIDKVEVRGI
ncbi:MAG: anaerobic ribonucleoside-triphosphate reductase activating protein [Thomasclavelia sp.]|nr:anaerobic ribonucleoside-triphosphate reductase activating protein [Thomasclavelia sp.]